MKETTNPFYSTPTAVLLGSAIIAAAILIHGGFIQIKGLTDKARSTSTNAPSSGSQPQAAQPKAAKTEADIVKGLKAQADKLGLDQSKFDQCLDSGGKASLVSADLDEGQTAGVNGTPAFFINGRLLAGAVPFSQFKTIIDQELNGTVPEGTEKKTVAVGNLPAQGSASAPVTIVQFSDYQCPFCERHFTQTEPQLKKDYIDTGKVKYYYRDFPLSQIHPGAQKGAEAARCAADQGKYWEYHDLVFENQSSIF